MNMGQMLMQQLTANNPAVARVMQMKNSGMTPQQAMQEMAKEIPQLQAMGTSYNQIGANMLREAGIDPKQFITQANNLMK